MPDLWLATVQAVEISGWLWTWSDFYWHCYQSFASVYLLTQPSVELRKWPFSKWSWTEVCFLRSSAARLFASGRSLIAIAQYLVRQTSFQYLFDSGFARFEGLLFLFKTSFCSFTTWIPSFEWINFSSTGFSYQPFCLVGWSLLHQKLSRAQEDF